eukprot:TRINITY_DN2026_c0_g1_i1.p1 TRINITY_DN2026_c0_g1~~TRINITY_DN2026_c0_g1_i1.p1  ORF type:complete len:346 (+),score=62.72 TRINITY_DN2026_c0_g1_i1:415-1452(+)
MLFMKSSFSVMFILLLLLFTIVFGESWKESKKLHFDNLAQADAYSLPNANYFANSLQDEANLKDVLEHLLVVRTVGSPGHRRVRSYIVDFMKNLRWNVEEQKFNSKTPLGNKEFTNIIASLNPSAPRQLVLACHYDSKIEPKGFLGAIDSAVPCAQMMNLAHAMRGVLSTSSYTKELSLQLIFFDGEEAFVKWNGEDSIYGARKLAETWEDKRVKFNNVEGNALDRIDLFVLLDLIGTKGPKFYSHFKQTRNWFALMQHIEDTLDSNNYLETSERVFVDQEGSFGIEDDHIPFLRRGVPILHLIPVPFPKVWHTINDDLSAIDFKTVSDLNKILRTFVATYLSIG